MRLRQPKTAGWRQRVAAQGKQISAIIAAVPLTLIAEYSLSFPAFTMAFQLACSSAANSKMQKTESVMAEFFPEDVIKT